MNEVKQIFSLFLSSDVTTELKAKLIDELNIEWFEEKWQKELHLYLANQIAKGNNPVTFEAIKYFREKNLFTKSFGISDLSNISLSFDMSLINRFDQVVNVIQYNYSIRVIDGTAKKIFNTINEGNGNIDELRGMLQEGIKATEHKIIHKESNDDVLSLVIKKHYEAMDGKPIGYELGFRSLHKVVLIEPVDMVVVAARPSMGKTAFGISMLLKLCFEQGYKVKLFALEMSKQQMMRRILSQMSGVASWKIKYGKCTEDEISRIVKIQNHPNWNNFEIIEGSQTADNVYFMASKWKMHGECDIVIVDYLQKLTSSRSTKKFEVVTYSSNRMKELSQDFGIPTICLAQLSRASEQRGGDKRPVLSDLRDSGEIEQDASIIAFLHRQSYYGYTVDDSGNNIENIGEFIISKNREGDLGVFNFKVDKNTIRWVDSEEHNEPLVEYAPNSLNRFANEDDIPF